MLLLLLLAMRGVGYVGSTQLLLKCRQLMLQLLYGSSLTTSLAEPNIKVTRTAHHMLIPILVLAHTRRRAVVRVQ